MEPREAHQSRGLTLCLNCRMRTVEERVRKGNVSELERDMLLAFEEQEKSSSATTPSSPSLLAALLSHRTFGLINPRPGRRRKLHSVSIEAQGNSNPSARSSLIGINPRGSFKMPQFMRPDTDYERVDGQLEPY